MHEPFLPRESYCPRCERPYTDVEPNYAPGFSLPIGCIPCRNKLLAARGLPDPDEERRKRVDKATADFCRQLAADRKAGRGIFARKEKKETRGIL